ncbi:hypothetical protein F3S47_03290 [Histidinibacterium aquaticum]|uniref:Energy transducer TonB n=1 Tax=Histidinibacterium aquaticum TaxID=2613962 RepID=A0A5J5GPH6_9RHOB|nr:hypothetical protein F3S47_03290 [Histidinibacterium aquaticum]
MTVAEEAQEQAAESEAPPEEVVEEPQEETAPEEAATEIVTEAEEPAASAPLASLRPQARPNRPAPPEPAPETEPTTTTASSEAAEEPEPPEVEEDAVDAAVEAALAGAAEATAPEAPSGPPLTGSEQEGFRVAVQACWNVDAGSEAARIAVTVGFSLDRNGRVEGSVRQISADDGPQAAVNAAFEAARRAVLRCQNANGRSGYDLPEEKYGQWRDVEMTFDARTPY